MSFKEQLASAKFAAVSAAQIIMEIYNNNTAEVTIKDDDSPVTQADIAADKLITNILKHHYPTYAFLTEESSDDKSRLANDFVWVVDPIDGTKDFINRTGEFTINIALVYKRRPVVGVVAIPAKNEMYFASEGNGAYYQVNDHIEKIHSNNDSKNLIAFRSRFHYGDTERNFYESHSDLVKEVVTVGSSIKACHIAHGLAHVYAKLTNGTKEWDIAASDIIVKEAGGLFVKPDGTPILYNRDDVYNREGFIVMNKLHEKLLVK